MTSSDVFVRWVLLRGLAMGILVFCIEHFIAIPEVSITRVALCGMVMPGVFLVLGLIEHAKRDRYAPHRSHST